jgi:hypothetical protein
MDIRRQPLFYASALGLALCCRGGFAAAAAPDCPPDEWFCAEEPADAGPDDGDRDDSSEPRPGDAERWPEAEDRAQEREDGQSSIVLSSGDERDALARHRFERRSDWSVNMRVQGVILESRRHSSEAGLGGVGASVRYRLNPVVTLDGGLDSIVGTDYNGNSRGELMLSFSSLFYFNPDRTIRTYAIVGLNASAAEVDVAGDNQSWGYFGAHAGLGLDIPLDRRVSLDLDLVGFLRGRTDDRAAREPEFEDDLGRVTNTSGGGLFRAGLSLFW